MQSGPEPTTTGTQYHRNPARSLKAGFSKAVLAQSYGRIASGLRVLLTQRRGGRRTWPQSSAPTHEFADSN